jgi:hypothetical protein
VQVRNNLTRTQEETAAGHERFAVRIVSRDRDDGGLDAFN